jgi:hypothetical protein
MPTKTVYIAGVQDRYPKSGVVYRIFAREQRSEPYWSLEFWTRDHQTSTSCQAAVYTGVPVQLETRPTKYGDEILSIHQAPQPAPTPAVAVGWDTPAASVGDMAAPSKMPKADSGAVWPTHVGATCVDAAEGEVIDLPGTDSASRLNSQLLSEE